MHALAGDWRACRLSAAMVGLLDYAVKLTRDASRCAECDVAQLRALGWSDRAIHAAVQVAAYFNYINRVADALGVPPEPGQTRWGQQA